MNKNKIKIKRRIKELKHALHEFNIPVSEYTDPDDLRGLLIQRFGHTQTKLIQQELCKEYAKLGVSMTDLSDDEKEKWK